MSNAIGDLLPKRQYEEPPEVRIIKDFVQEKFQKPVGVTVQTNAILIHVKGAALAGALRMELHKLQSQLDSKKRLVIRLS